jgi:hypothetical protein
MYCWLSVLILSICSFVSAPRRPHALPAATLKSLSWDFFLTMLQFPFSLLLFFMPTPFPFPSFPQLTCMAILAGLLVNWVELSIFLKVTGSDIWKDLLQPSLSKSSKLSALPFTCAIKIVACSHIQSYLWTLLSIAKRSLQQTIGECYLIAEALLVLLNKK